MSDPSELPSIAAEPLSVILLAANAAAVLSEVLGGWVAQLEGLKRPYEIILVDDGTTDGTGGLARFFAGRLPRVRVLEHSGPQGLGAALRYGLATARYPLLFYTTCDRQYRPDDLPHLLGVIDKVHLVSGYRVWRPVPGWLRWLGRIYRGLARLLVGTSHEPLPGWLGWSGHARRWLARWFFGVRTEDVDCAFRLFRRLIFDRIPIQSDGAFAQVEILAKANFLGCLMAEEPVTYRPNPPGQAALTRDRWRRTLREARQLLARPDFGPAVLPGPPTAGSVEAKEVEPTAGTPATETTYQ
jgi:glycosyltransferase involved in cell wall biosynthesis